ncbi:MAG TPA: hypothetical protein VMV53_09715 [Acidimicrobiales bacterium]|nr:hypothetical protein [Acidimicrobiales bacterium]
MSSPHASASEVVRRSLLKISPLTVLTAVDSLDLRASNQISAVVGVPLRTLQQRRDVAAFAVSAPIAAVRALVEILAAGALDEVVRELDEHAESPSFDQLSEAIDRLSAQGVSDDDLVAMLSFAVGEQFAAAAHCRRLLDERPDFLLPPLPEVGTPSTLATPREVAPEIRAQRRARREAQRQQKLRKPSPPSRPSRPPKSKQREVTVREVSAPSDHLTVTATAAVVRRRLTLTPAESARFSAEHPLSGTVVLIEVPFDAVDPEAAELHAKQRPALVVAASDSAVLVRPIYSNPFSNRTLFHAWRRLQLDHVCYISDERVALEVLEARLEELGRLSDEEWNSLY